ncbi:MAG: SdpI family protein [Methanoregulaceae archaeon]|jgi:uncharacterized membrane protein
MRKSEIVCAALILISFIAGIYLYSPMPYRMASHWNISGDVDGYMSKFWGVFLVPLIAFGLFLLFLIIPHIDPKKHNIEQFRVYYDRFFIVIIVFILYIYLLTLLWNLNVRFNLIQLMTPAFAVLFYYSGVVISHAKMNWFVGIRTPWTLSSEKVWNQTHALGGKLFKITGIIALLGIIFINYALFFILVPLIVVGIYTVVYSYFAYREETKMAQKS